MIEDKNEATNIIGVYWICDNGRAYVGDTVQVKTTWGSIYYGKILSATEDGGFKLNCVDSIMPIHVLPNTIRALKFVRGNNGRYHARYS